MTTLKATNLFGGIETAPPDPILGLGEAFRQDANPKKINLSVGVYQDESGATPVLRCVKSAEEQLLAEEKTKTYLGIEGIPAYGNGVRELLFGTGSEPLTSGRVATLQTPGGTGALRVAADFLQRHHPSTTVWCSTPTWANHPHIFRSAGLKVGNYAYLDKSGAALDFDALLSSLESIPAGDTICLHACCHNPTGVDPTAEQWSQIIELMGRRHLIPLIDFAYQGFGSGVDEDAQTVRSFVSAGLECLVCSSFSKNFGLYGERTGALTLVADNASAAQAALSQAKVVVRANYSNPPKHGGAIVSTILQDAGLKTTWLQELAEMRQRIAKIRELFVRKMAEKTTAQDFSFIQNQTGMFSFSGLNGVQVDELRSKYSIYIVGSGRINVAGINSRNIDPLCEAIAAVL